MNDSNPALDAAAEVWGQMTDEEEAALIDWLDGRSSD